MVSAKAINQTRQTPAVPVWQRNYYDHIIRQSESYGQIADYTLTNHERWADDRFYRI